MGFLDSLLGTTKLPPAKPDRLFAISTAAVTMDSRLELRPGGAAGVCLKPVDAASYERASSEIQELLSLSEKESGTSHSFEKDEYGYIWIVLLDKDLDDLVAGVQMVCQILTEQGYGEQLLCAVFRFDGQRPIYWIFNFKQGSFYPFVPLGNRVRDTAMESRLRAILKGEMPIEKDEGRWFPLWGMPL